MNAFQFGRQLRIKIAQQPPMRTQMQPGGTLTMNPGPNTPASPSALVSGGTQGANIRPAGQSRPAAPPKPPGSTGSFFQEWMNPPKPARSSGAPTNSPYINALDRWYNPWTKQTGREAGEQGLMRAGQAAMGVGAAAATAAGAITAAPAVAGMMTGGGATTTAGVGGGAAAATQTPAGQNLLQRGSQMAGQFANTANQVVNTYDTRVKPVLDSVGYKPTDIALDGYAAATGNFDKIKGPNWGVKFPGGNMPLGAPTVPRPLETWKGVTAAGGNVLPAAVTSALGFKRPNMTGMMRQ